MESLNTGSTEGSGALAGVSTQSPLWGSGLGSNLCPRSIAGSGASAGVVTWDPPQGARARQESVHGIRSRVLGLGRSLRTRSAKGSKGFVRSRCLGSLIRTL